MVAKVRRADPVTATLDTGGQCADAADPSSTAEGGQDRMRAMTIVREQRLQLVEQKPIAVRSIGGGRRGAPAAHIREPMIGGHERLIRPLTRGGIPAVEIVRTEFL